MLGKSILDFVPKDDVEYVKGILSKIIKSEESVIYETAFHHAEGNSIYYETNAVPRLIDDKCVGVLLSSRDITERKSAARALSESESKFKSTFENAGIGMTIVSMDDMLVETNPSMRKFLGYNVKEMFRLDVKDFSHPQDMELDFQNKTNAIESGADAFHMEKRYFHKNGETIWGYLTWTLVRDQKGNPLFGIGMVEDITARKKSEQALKKSGAKFRSIFEQAAVGVARVGLSGTIIEANSKLEQMLGYSEGELVGVDVFEITSEEDSEIERQFSAQLLAGKRNNYNMEKRFFRKDGSMMWGRLTVSVARNSLGDIDFTIGVLEDITDQKRDEAVRLQHEQEIDLYSSLLKHDLSNDLGLILSYIEAVQMILESPDEEVKSFLNSALASVERMSELLRSFLKPQEVREIDIVEFIEEIADEAQEVEKGLQVAIAYKKGVEDIRITTGGLLGLVFMNLFRNSAQHGGESPEVQVQVSKKQSQIEIIVSDNGPGVPKEFQKKLFARGTSSKGEAGGLGLHLCKQIVERTGGSIQHLATKKGATFRILLPI